MTTITRLRPLVESDHDAVFSMMAEPDAVAMAAFTADDPADRTAFDAQMMRVAANAENKQWAVTDGSDTVVGTIATFPSESGDPEVTYWIAQSHWGQGHASRALKLALDQTRRPVLARVASDNARSLQVLEKSGFEIIGKDRDYAAGRRTETDELILRLS